MTHQNWSRSEQAGFAVASVPSWGLPKKHSFTLALVSPAQVLSSIFAFLYFVYGGRGGDGDGVKSTLRILAS